MKDTDKQTNYKKISILLTADEEGDAKYGTNEMLKWLYSNNYHITHCIIGEPTSINQVGDNIKTGRKGSTNFELHISGIQGHVAYPENLQNSNLFLSIFFTDLQNYFSKYNQDDIHFEITELKCINKTTNLVPGHVSSKFNFRYNHKFSFAVLENIIYNILDNIIKNVTFKKKFNHIKYQLITNHAADSFLCNYENSNINLKKILEKSILITTNKKPKNINNGGTSDARFIIKYCQTIEIGTRYETAHKKNEHIYCNDLKILYNIYSIALKEILMYNKLNTDVAKW
ncbi:MAG: M20/M25/M40 family metallo-hydrolase [Rickettsiales bacterium]